MAKTLSANRYYLSLLWDAHQFSREKHEGLVFLIAEIASLAIFLGPRLKGEVGAQFDWYLSRHPYAPVILFGGLLLFAVARENWRRVKARDAEIALLRREQGETYKILCERAERGRVLVLMASNNLVQGGTVADTWVQTAFKFTADTLAQLEHRLLPSQIPGLKGMAGEGARPVWSVGTGVTDLQLGLMGLCQSITAHLQALSVKYEPAAPWATAPLLSGSGTGARSRRAGES